MEQFSLPLGAADASVDVFDIERMTRAPAPSADPSASDNANDGPATKQRALPTIRPIHFGLVTLIVAAIWIAWPAARTSSKPTTRPEAQHIVTAAASGNSAATPAGVQRQWLQSEHSRETPTAPVAESGAVNPVASTPANSQALASPAPAKSDLDSRILDLQASQAKALLGAVDGLHLRLAAVEAKMEGKLTTANPAASQSPVPATMALLTPPVATGVNGTSSAINKPDKPARRQPPQRLSGYEINTIYRGQAWINHGEHTFVVQEGSILDGLKITRIDPGARVVHTNLGLIR